MALPLRTNVRLPPKADIGTQSWNVRFVPSKPMSGAAGATRHRPASRILKNKSKISSAEPIRKTAYRPPGTPGSSVLKTQKRDTCCARNFFIAAGQTARKL
jgi:hypothetical protein